MGGWIISCSSACPTIFSFDVFTIQPAFISPHHLFPCFFFFPLQLSWYLPPVVLPLPLFPAVPSLTGDLVEHWLHTAGCIHTDVSTLVLFCPASRGLDLYCRLYVALWVSALSQFHVLCCLPPSPCFPFLINSLFFMLFTLTFHLCLAHMKMMLLCQALRPDSVLPLFQSF